MGNKIVRFEFTPNENEQIDALITIPEEPRSMIHGVIKNSCGDLVRDAVVKLFLMKDSSNPCDLEPLTHAFTDEFGQFMFGPLCPYKCYVIKAWVDNVVKREIHIHEHHCDDSCEEDVQLM